MINIDDISVDFDKLRAVYNIRNQCDRICRWFLDHRGSIRMCSEELQIPKSTIHYYIHSYIRTYYDEEYVQIINILKYNSIYRRLPRKFWKH